MMTARVNNLPSLVMFEFWFDDPQFRKRLFNAILCHQCPNFECSLGSPSSTGSSYTALWRVAHADAVRTWAQSVGIRIHSADGSLRNKVREEPSINVQLPDSGDIAPGGIVGSCIIDVERMLTDQRMEPTALNWLAVCDHFRSLPLLCAERAAAFRLLRQAIERVALTAVKIDPRPVPGRISQEVTK